MAIDSQATWQLVDALKDTSKTNEHTSLATVNRVDTEGRVWVSLPGGEVETPTETSNAEVKRGDTVTVEWRGNKLYILGNSSDPSVGAQRVDVIDELANQAYQSANEASANADIAKVAADNAQASADQAATAAATADQKATAASSAATQAQTDAAAAQTAASNAQTAASNAQTSANNAASAAAQATQDAATAGRAASVAQAAAEAAQDDIDELEEWFWHDTNGSHVLGATSGYRNDIDSTGMTIVETATEDAVASFGADGAVIGKTDETHTVVDYHSLRLVDKEGGTYFHVSDLRDKDDNYQATITEIFQGDGTQTGFEVVLPVSDEVSATDSSDPSNTAERSNKTYTFQTAPEDGATVTIVYKTTSQLAKAYTLGTRYSGSVIGALSLAEGVDTTSSGFVSHAEGSYSQSSGYASHAEGHSARASGQSSHAEGTNSAASGTASHAEGISTKATAQASHAQNLYTEAKYEAQTVIGKYNRNRSDTAFEIGNGREVNVRSNAFTVDWDGNTEAAGDITDGSGNVLSDKADTTDLADYLPLAGGTLTGLLDQDMPGIVRDTPPSSAQWIDRIALCDANGEVIGYLRTPFHTDGREGVQIETKRTVNGAEVYNGVQFYINASGTRTVDVSDAAAWRDALALGSLAQKDNLAASDIPSLPASKIGSGVLSKARGGTGTADFGTVQNTDGSTKSVANSTNTELTNFTLAAGTWLVVAGFTFAANSTGRRVMSINTSSGSMSSARTQQLSLRATDGGRMDGEVVSILSPTASTKYYANCWQNSGGALNASVYVRAIRLA